MPEEKWGTTCSLKRINNGFSDSLWLACSRRSDSIEVRGEVTEELGGGGGGGVRQYGGREARWRKKKTAFVRSHPNLTPLDVFPVHESLCAVPTI